MTRRTAGAGGGAATGATGPGGARTRRSRTHGGGGGAGRTAATGLRRRRGRTGRRIVPDMDDASPDRQRDPDGDSDAIPLHP